MASKSNKNRYKKGGQVDLSGYSELGTMAGNLLQNTNSPAGTIGGSMLSGAAAGSALGPWGVIGGAVVGLGSGLLQNHQNNEMQKQQEQMMNQIRVQQSLAGFQNANKLYDMGGGLPQNSRKPVPGMNKQGNITEYNGLQHEQGGLPIGQNAEVENNETRGIGNTKDYVYSDSLRPDKKSKKTFADLSKAVERKYKNYDNDRYAIKAKDMELSKLMYEQEALKKSKYEKEMQAMAKKYPEYFQAMQQAQAQQAMAQQPQNPQEEQQEGAMSNPQEESQETQMMYGGDFNNISWLKDGGGIHINPANKGKFNATKARTGKTTE